MGILTNLFSGGAADLVKNVGGVLDDLTTTKEEKLQAEQKIKQLVSDYETKMEQNITDRWSADMNSDSWLSKNVRPLVLIFLVVCTVLMIFVDAGSIKFEVKDTWVDLLQLVLITVIGAYFGGRSFEKSKKIKN
jgi:cation transport ATPase